jgi:hypothetical protein
VRSPLAAQSSRGGRIGGQMNILIEKNLFSALKNFKLWRQIKGNLLNVCDSFKVRNFYQERPV